MVTIIKALIDNEGGIRLYRSPWTAPTAPQGQRLLPAPDDPFFLPRVAYALFPVLISAPAINDAGAMCNWSRVSGGWMTDCGNSYPAKIKLDNSFDRAFTYCPGCGRPIFTDKI